MELCCPLTHKIMTDPVICSDGWTYEKSAIREQLVVAEVSPVTGETLFGGVRPNYLVKQLIAAYESECESRDISCPISLGPFFHPVVASDGHTYEQEQIELALKNQQKKSPITREDLFEGFWPNRVLNKIAEGVASRVRASPEPAHEPYVPPGSLDQFQNSIVRYHRLLTEKDARALVSLAGREDQLSGWSCCSRGTNGSNKLQEILEKYPDRFDQHARAIILEFLKF